MRRRALSRDGDERRPAWRRSRVAQRVGTVAGWAVGIAVYFGIPLALIALAVLVALRAFGWAS